MPEAGPEIPKVDEIVGEEVEERGRYGRFIAVAVVLTTLVGALVAFAQASALRTHDQADARAEANGALALNTAAVDRGKAETQIDRFNLLTQQIRQADSATLTNQYGTTSRANTLDAARWNGIAKQTESDTAAIASSQDIPYICSTSLQKHCSARDASFSPERDPEFPNRYMEQSQWHAYRLTALRDAANQQADDAEGKFVNYAAALTMLAVAVFLFGYSLTPQGQARRILYSRVAVVFVVVAGVWALYQVLTPVATPPDAAATAFANGQVAENTANDQAAIADYNRALAMRPRFVDAYIDRADVEYDAGIPHTGTGANSATILAGGVTVPTRAALDKATADLEHAHDDGSNSATLYSDLAGDLGYRGLLENSSSDLSQSRTYAQQAIETFRSQENVATFLAQTYFVAAEDDLALGRPAAGAEYRAAEDQLRDPAVNVSFVVGPALTDLSLIETERPKLTQRVDALKEQIVAQGEIYYTSKGKPYETTPNGYAPSKGYASHIVHLGGVQAEPDPGHALYVIGSPHGFNPTYDLLSAQWEYQDPVHHEWAVLPELSGPVTPGGLVSLHPGYVSNNPSYVSTSTPSTCLPPGKYRVQLFVNGHLAGSATAKTNWPSLHAVQFSEVDGAVCVPEGWNPFPNLGAGADGYAAGDDSSGAFLLSIPKSAIESIAYDQPALASIMQATIRGFASGSNSLLPGLTSATKVRPTRFFMSTTNGQLQDWTYNNGYVYTAVGTANNGQTYIGIAWSHSNDLAYNLYLSLSPL
jgi:tetratricopeptide (TPR) repeat protein